MKFKAGDKVKVLTKNSFLEGKIGEVVYVFEHETGNVTECSEFGGDLAVIPFMESELELVDEELDALISLAESLNEALGRAQTVGRMDLHVEIRRSLGTALDAIFVHLAVKDNLVAVSQAYVARLRGVSVRDAIAAVVENGK